jgi:Zn-dependent protease with chaperone function
VIINRERLPDDSVNVSNKSPLLEFLKFISLLFIVVSAIFWSIQLSIDRVVDSISEEKALELMRASSSYISMDSKEDDNLSKVANRVLNCIDLPFTPKFFVINLKKTNAFAMANGNVYLTKSLLSKIENDEELAFVIGHELGHFKNRDHLKGLGMRLIILMFTLLIGDSSGSSISVSTILNFQTAKYSQSSEIKADKVALRGLICSYGRVDGAITIFKKLRDEGEKSYLFSSHPSFEKRLEIIRGWRRED